MGFFLPLGVSLPPMGAAAAMAFSSVSVVTSSLALKWWVRPAESLMPGESVQHETMFDSARETVRDAWDSPAAGGDERGCMMWYWFRRRTVRVLARFVSRSNLLSIWCSFDLLGLHDVILPAAVGILRAVLGGRNVA
ncbi:hypothetical protein VTO73DRAFT_2757 [Trametes versicolor]